MNFRESITIRSTPEVVWPYIADPVLMAQWNPKIVESHRGPIGPVRLGERFEIVFKISTRPVRTVVDVIECQPPTRLVLRHNRPDAFDEYADLTYDVSETDKGCRLVQNFDLARWRIALGWRVLIWMISRFGERQGSSHLEVLKEQVEAESAPA